MKVINRRQQYLDRVRKESRKIWRQVVEDYNAGMPIDEIRLKYINEQTGEPYSRTHIYTMIRKMRQES